MSTQTGRATLALTLPLIKRGIGSRYRGSMLGLLWSLLSPLFMLSIYTFVFGVVMQARWTVPGAESAAPSTIEFGVILFAGLILYQFFAEIIGNAPGLVIAHTNYVKKLVFPVIILPVVSLGTALFHMLVSASVLIAFAIFVFGIPSPTALLAPLALVALIPMALGFSWFLAAAGVYFRDIGQILPPIITAMLFLSPILFPRSALPEALRFYLVFNPLSVPVETFRNALLFGIAPNWLEFGLYMLVAVTVAVLGFLFFRLMRRGFADVL